jgi:streptogramin lyase
MKTKLLSISIILGFGMVVILLVGVASAANFRRSQEIDLTPNGYAYEVNPDARDNLWVSEFHANQVWQIDPAAGTYTIYQGLKTVSDARMDSNGDVWWSNFGGHTLGQLDPEASIVTSWTLPSGVFPLGIAFDNSGDVWVTDNFSPHLIRFDKTQLCSYEYIGSGSAYVTYQDGVFWLGDEVNHQIVKFDPSTGNFTTWSLRTNSKPVGLATDKQQNLWWADKNGSIGMLNPTLDIVTVYTLPITTRPTKPKMVALSETAVWYTESFSSTGVVTGTVGALYPSAAAHFTYTVTPVITPVSSISCYVITSIFASVVPSSTGTLSWTSESYTNTINAGGWQIYQLPTGAKPWGIASVNNDIYFSDNGRQKLGWLKNYSSYFPLMFR